MSLFHFLESNGNVIEVVATDHAEAQAILKSHGVDATIIGSRPYYPSEKEEPVRVG